MKNIFLITILLLYNSCTTYKKIEKANFIVGKHYEIIDSYGNKQKITLLGVKQDSIIVQNNNNALTIPNANITDIKEKKFSWLKTIGLVIATGAVATGAAILVVLKTIGG